MGGRGLALARGSAPTFQVGVAVAVGVGNVSGGQTGAGTIGAATAVGVGGGGTALTAGGGGTVDDGVTSGAAFASVFSP